MDPDPDTHQLKKWDPDPDLYPHQNVLDPPHWLKRKVEGEGWLRLTKRIEPTKVVCTQLTTVPYVQRFCCENGYLQEKMLKECCTVCIVKTIIMEVKHLTVILT